MVLSHWGTTLILRFCEVAVKLSLYDIGWQSEQFGKELLTRFTAVVFNLPWQDVLAQLGHVASGSATLVWAP